MNEPYQRVSRQDQHNSTIGTIASHVGLQLAGSAAFEGATYLGAKKVNPTKHPQASQILNNMAFGEGIEGKGKAIQALSAGMSTKKGRIVNYGVSAGMGLLSGSLAASAN